jgi:xylan 1,4-beta-xylosidase
VAERFILFLFGGSIRVVRLCYISGLMNVRPAMKSRVSQVIVFASMFLGTLVPMHAQEVINIDPKASVKPFPHFWEEAFGSGRAVLTLRESYRDDLRATKESTGFQFVRFHAIFHDEMGVYNQDAQGNPVYNFSYVDQVYDGLLANGVKPFVELGFMPRQLAANLTPHPFWYKQLPSPPKDPARWTALVAAFVNHLIERYGKPEVESWYFEVWNEPNIDFWNGVPKEQTYYTLYDATARTIKGIDSQIRVGGPATAQAAWVDRFIAHCIQNHVPFDFVSSHIYGNEKPEDIFGKHLDISHRDMVGLAARKVYDQVKASAAPDTPIIWSEYNATYMNLPSTTDSAFMGPWLANNIRECDGLTSMMSYWTFSDVFEEQGIIKTPFYGGFGLIAERGIPKAAFRAFQLLHQLGHQRLSSTSENALITKRDDGAIVIALWNYADAGKTGPAKAFQLKAANGAYSAYRIQTVDSQHGSPLEKWRAMGEPKYPSPRQIAELKQDSELAPAAEHKLSEQIVLPAHALALVHLER